MPTNTTPAAGGLVNRVVKLTSYLGRRVQKQVVAAAVRALPTETGGSY